MKKHLLVAFAIVMTLTFTVMLLTACGNADLPSANEVETPTDVHNVHTYGDWEVTKTPTCTENGERKRTCTVCGKVDTETMSRASHTYGEWEYVEGQEPTCTERGRQVKKCTVCGDVWGYETAPALGHDYDEEGVCTRCEYDPLEYEDFGETTCQIVRCKKGTTEVYIPRTRNGKTVVGIKDEPYYSYSGANNEYSSYEGGVFSSSKNTLTSVTFAEGTQISKIPKEAFNGCYQLTTINLPATLTTIGSMAFYGCRNLTEVDLYEGLLTIGHEAFYNCASLTSIHIPASLTDLGRDEDNEMSNPFAGCSGLTEITVENGNQRYHSAGNCLIETSRNTVPKTLIAGCSTSVIPSDGSVTKIGNRAFSGCSRMASLHIPASVNAIGEYAFHQCTGLTEITVAEGNTKYSAAGNCLIEKDTNTLIVGSNNSVIPTDGSVTKIGSHAFEYRRGLTSIVIPDCVTEIGDLAFFGCEGLTSVFYPASKPKIRSLAFDGCYKAKYYYYSETEPTSEGNWWHFVDGVPTPWAS